jgi:hypothetical protein
MPLVCMGFAFERPWRQKSWDHFAIPRPFSRARAVISGFIDIPPHLELRNPKSEIRNPKQFEQEITEKTERPSNSVSSVASCSSVLSDFGFRIPDLEYWRLCVERTLNQVTEEAESWADSGRRKPGEMPLLRHQPAPQMARPAA